MRKSTFCKLVKAIRKISDIPSNYESKNMLVQALEEDSCAAFGDIYKMVENENLDPEIIWEQMMKNSYLNCAPKGVNLKEMLYEGIIDSNAIIAISELYDEEDDYYYERVWEGMAHELPLQYTERLGQIHGVISDDIWKSDIIQIHLYPLEEEI